MYIFPYYFLYIFSLFLIRYFLYIFSYLLMKTCDSWTGISGVIYAQFVHANAELTIYKIIIVKKVSICYTSVHFCCTGQSACSTNNGQCQSLCFEKPQVGGTSGGSSHTCHCSDMYIESTTNSGTQCLCGDGKVIPSTGICSTSAGK